MPITLPVSYTTIDEVKQTLPEIGSITTLSSKDIALFVGQGESQINARLSKRYAMPLTSDFPMLQTLSTDIGLYRLLSRRLFTADQLEDSPWPDRFKEAMEDLDLIADGTILLVDSSGAVLSERTDIRDIYSTSTKYDPTMYEGHFHDMIVDEDKIEDENDKRD